jgi:dihydroneopterin aldolase
MKIYIEDLTFECIIGLLEFERTTPQKVIVNFQCEYDFEDNVYLDYSTIANDIINIMQKGQFELLEVAILEIKEALLKEYDLTDIFIKITKPNILPNMKVSVSN